MCVSVSVTMVRDSVWETKSPSMHVCVYAHTHSFMCNRL